MWTASIRKEKVLKAEGRRLGSGALANVPTMIGRRQTSRTNYQGEVTAAISLGPKIIQLFLCLYRNTIQMFIPKAPQTLLHLAICITHG